MKIFFYELSFFIFREFQKSSDQIILVNTTISCNCHTDENIILPKLINLRGMHTVHNPILAFHILKAFLSQSSVIFQHHRPP